MLLGTVMLAATGVRADDAREEATKVLAPSGRLRVGVYMGSPTSEVVDPKTGEAHGVTYELGRELAARLNVPVEYMTYPRVADAVAAVKDGQIDFTVSNASPQRANEVRFSVPLLALELGYLVPPKSAIARSEDIDQPKVRIGVTKASTSERTLGARFKNAEIVAAESVKTAVEMLGRGDLDVYATNKAILFEMSDALPGARVLDGNWGQEHMAIAIPRGREQGLALVNSFVREVQSNGELQQIEQQAGLRGAVEAK